MWKAGPLQSHQEQLCFCRSAGDSPVVMGQLPFWQKELGVLKVESKGKDFFPMAAKERSLRVPTAQVQRESWKKGPENRRYLSSSTAFPV